MAHAKNSVLAVACAIALSACNTAETPPASPSTVTMTTTKTSHVTVTATPVATVSPSPLAEPTVTDEPTQSTTRKDTAKSVETVAEQFVIALLTWKLKDTTQVDASRRAAKMATPSLAASMIEDRPTTLAFAEWKKRGVPMKITLEKVTDTPPADSKNSQYRAFAAKLPDDTTQTVYLEMVLEPSGWKVKNFRSEG